MKEIYVLEAAYDYEGSELVRAFVDEEEAKKVMTDANQYHRTRPPYPENYEDEQVWDAYEQAEREWRLNHPAGPDCTGCDEYRIRKCELIGG